MGSLQSFPVCFLAQPARAVCYQLFPTRTAAVAAAAAGGKGARGGPERIGLHIWGNYSRILLPLVIWPGSIPDVALESV